MLYAEMISPWMHLAATRAPLNMATETVAQPPLPNSWSVSWISLLSTAHWVSSPDTSPDICSLSCRLVSALSSTLTLSSASVARPLSSMALSSAPLALSSASLALASASVALPLSSMALPFAPLALSSASLALLRIFATLAFTLSLVPSCVLSAMSVRTHSLVGGPAVEGRCWNSERGGRWMG